MSSDAHNRILAKIMSWVNDQNRNSKYLPYFEPEDIFSVLEEYVMMEELLKQVGQNVSTYAEDSDKHLKQIEELTAENCQLTSQNSIFIDNLNVVGSQLANAYNELDAATDQIGMLNSQIDDLRNVVNILSDHQFECNRGLVMFENTISELQDERDGLLDTIDEMKAATQDRDDYIEGCLV